MEKYLAAQKDLIRILGNKIRPKSDKARYKLLNEYLTCISSEVEEARMDLPWKHWKDYKDFKFDKLHFIEETIDILHFLLDIWIILGLDHLDIAVAYNRKKAENIRRWTRVHKPERRKQMGKKLLRPNH